MPEAVAPIIVVPPINSSAVAGSSEVTLECIASARYVAPVPWCSPATLAGCFLD